VFTGSGGTWSQQAELTASDAEGASFFGYSVSLSGATALVGAYNHAFGSTDIQGAAYLFTGLAGIWSQQAELTAADGFGYSVSLSGTTALVAGSDDTVGSNTNQGAVYVFSPATVVVTVSGSQTYGSSSPTFTYATNPTPLPVGLALSGTLACATVNGGATKISAALAPGSDTVYGQSCSGLVLSNTTDYTLSYVGATNGFVVSPAPATLLGSGAGTLGLSGQSAFSVVDSLAVDSSSNGAVSLSGQSTLKVTGALISPVAKPVSSTGHSSESVGTAEQLGPEPDPYAGLAAPSTAGMTVYNSSTISGPGVYTAAVSISGQSHVQLASGAYVFEKGLTVSGQSTLTSAAGGVLLCFAGGTLTVSGQAAVTLTPLQTGAYGGIVVFQAHGDTAALSLSSQSQKTSFDGTVYAPSAEVDISGQASVFLQALVAESATLTGQGKATAG
jgi:hypothetical protein